MKNRLDRPILRDTMISARDFRKLTLFYTRFVGLKCTARNQRFAALMDPKSRQCLCITNGESVDRASPGIQVQDLDAALKRLARLGGKVRKRWDYGAMRGANCKDPEGNEIMVWQVTGGPS